MAKRKRRSGAGPLSVDRRHDNPGRPVLPESERTAVRTHVVRLSVEADALVRAAAKLGGVTLAQWWRQAVVAGLGESAAQAAKSVE